MWSPSVPPWTTRLEPSRPWLRITKAGSGRGADFRAAGVFDREAAAVVGAGAAVGDAAATAAVEGVVADAAVEPVGVAVADDRVALGRADHVLEAAEVVVAVAFGLVGCRG